MITESKLKKYELDPNKIPRHIAIIMDGNGRWAKARGLSRIEGHRAAVKAVRETVEICVELGIEYLTLYAFSVDNWRRPKKEVDALMRLLKQFLKKERSKLMEHEIRLVAIGRLKELPLGVQEEIKKTTSLTRNNKGLTLILALNYGGRSEIVDSVKRCITDIKKGNIDINDINEENFSDYLYTKNIPDPDLLIRTSGEYRISNFLLWQISYSEIWITPILWPDFRKKHVVQSIKEYGERERRYGGVK